MDAPKYEIGPNGIDRTPGVKKVSVSRAVDSYFSDVNRSITRGQKLDARNLLSEAVARNIATDPRVRDLINMLGGQREKEQADSVQTDRHGKISSAVGAAAGIPDSDPNNPYRNIDKPERPATLEEFNRRFSEQNIPPGVTTQDVKENPRYSAAEASFRPEGAIAGDRYRQQSLEQRTAQGAASIEQREKARNQASTDARRKIEAAGDKKNLASFGAVRSAIAKATSAYNNSNSAAAKAYEAGGDDAMHKANAEASFKESENYSAIGKFLSEERARGQIDVEEVNELLFEANEAAKNNVDFDPMAIAAERGMLAPVAPPSRTPPPAGGGKSGEIDLNKFLR